MSESDMRGKLIKALKPLHAVAIENRVGLGTPDVNCIGGWIELKWLRAWPKRAKTIVRVKRFSLEQRIWLQRRFDLGGRSWLLLQVRREWLLFTGPVAAEHVGYVDREGLYEQTHARWTTGLDAEEMIECLMTYRLPTAKPSLSTVVGGG